MSYLVISRDPLQTAAESRWQRDRLLQSLDGGTEEVLPSSGDDPLLLERNRNGRRVRVDSTDRATVILAILSNDRVQAVEERSDMNSFMRRRGSPWGLGGLLEGREVGVVGPAYVPSYQNLQEQAGWLELTLLDELEAGGEVALVGDEEQTTTVLSLLVLLLATCYLRAELDTAAHDPVLLDGDAVLLQVSARQSLPDVGSERAELLKVPLSGEVEVVPPAQ